tara:strand:- start:826 stop:1236 length:411 start_codon:yes stop_codon:yes gene_type:complete
MTHTLTIGAVAKLAEVNIETMRYYERRGLVPRPPRSTSNYRQYPEETVRRVRFIKRAQELGFTLKEIKGLLALRVTPRAKSSQVRERVRHKIEAVDAKIKALEAMRSALASLEVRCSGRGNIGTCSILRSLDENDA